MRCLQHIKFVIAEHLHVLKCFCGKGNNSNRLCVSLFMIDLFSPGCHVRKKLADTVYDISLIGKLEEF